MLGTDSGRRKIQLAQAGVKTDLKLRNKQICSEPEVTYYVSPAPLAV